MIVSKKMKVLAATAVLSVSSIGQIAHADLFDFLKNNQAGKVQTNKKKTTTTGNKTTTTQQQQQQGAVPVRKTYKQVEVSNDKDAEAQRIAAEEARLGRPLTAGEKEVKVAMDRFLYQPRVNLPFITTRTEWTEQDEVNFGNFVARIGAAVQAGKCGTATKCLRDASINPYAERDPSTFQVYADCADLPYVLRTYFAYHEGLPFSYVTGVAMNSTAYTSAQDRDKDLENASMANSPYGNRIVSRGGNTVAPASGQERQLISYLENLINNTGTITNRVGPMTPGVNQSDIFPVALNKRGVRPGSIVAATGHAMIVWKVTKNGEIRIIDGHPGNFIQEKLLDASMIKMSRPDQGIGYYQFRPLRLVGAKQGASGYLYGGKIVPVSNDELMNQGRYSLDQFFGPGSNVQPGQSVSPNMWKGAFKGTSVFQYLADNLREKGLKMDAVEFVKGKMDYICGALQERMKNYANSQEAGVAMQKHPDTLIQDIFSAQDATWEKFSTPGGDSRLRDSIRGLVIDAANAYRQAKNGGSYTFQGGAQAYADALRQALAEKNASCKLSYTNSNGDRVNLTLNKVTARMNKISFDPFMCAEKTWGASGDELATCRDRDQGNRWYNAEKYLRNVIGKTDDEGNASIRSDRPITIEMLEDMNNVDQPHTSEISLGTSTPPPMNLDAIFASEAFLSKLSK